MLVVIEGIDGSGKGTQAALLLTKALEEGYDAALFSFPRYEHTLGGRMVGEYLNGEFGSLDAIHPKLACLPYALDRLETKELLLAHLRVRDLVICDRYVYSNVAHQCAKITGMENIPKGLALRAWIYDLEFKTNGLPVPELVINFDLPVHLAAKLIAAKQARKYTDKKADLHEANLPYLDRVRAWYGIMGSDFTCRETWKTIKVHTQTEPDEIRTVEAVADDVWEAVRPKLTCCKEKD